MDTCKSLNLNLAARALNIIRAADASPTNQAQQHADARQLAQDRYQEAVNDFVAHAKAEALAKDKKKRERLKAIFLLLMLDAGEDAYSAIYPRLAGISGASPTIPVKAEPAEFAAGRAKYLENFSSTVLDRLDAVIQQGAHDAESPREIRRKLDERAKEIKEGAGKTTAETEAQSTYGAAQIRVLKRAGMTHKIWQTMEDDRVRDSHENCQLQGAIPMDEKFQNGLRYPGETGAPPSETVNCRCWLRGQKL